MALYRKKPIVIHAEQWPGDADDATWAMSKVFHRRMLACDHPAHEIAAEMALPSHIEWAWIATLEGGHIVQENDFIITGVKGEKYPCKPDVFEATYEPA